MYLKTSKLKQNCPTCGQNSAFWPHVGTEMVAREVSRTSRAAKQFIWTHITTYPKDMLFGWVLNTFLITFFVHILSHFLRFVGWKTTHILRC